MQTGFDEKVSMDSTARSTARRDFVLSLIFMSLLVAFVLSGLALDANWRKLARVGLGFSTYLFVLLSLVGGLRLFEKRRAPIPFPVFALSAAAAELASGWLRPTARSTVDFAVALAAALLIGGTHWLALRTWRPLRTRIVGKTQKAV